VCSRLYYLGLCKYNVWRPHRRNRLTTHFSERIPVVKRRMTVYFIGFGIQHAPYCHLRPARLYNIFPHYIVNGTIVGGGFLNIKLVFWFSLYLFLLQHFSLYEEFGEIWSKMYIGLHVQYQLFLLDFNETWIFSTDFRKILVSNLANICPVVAELFDAKLRATIRNFAGAPTAMTSYPKEYLHQPGCQDRKHFALKNYAFFENPAAGWTTRQGQDNFLFSRASRTPLDAPPSFLFNSNRYFRRVNRAGARNWPLASM
jgi:hypothetical protein